VYVVVFLLILGLLVLLRILDNPRLETIHGSDVVQIMAAGICFGVSFGLLMGKRKFRGE
jgi:hypothetical protein